MTGPVYRHERSTRVLWSAIVMGLVVAACACGSGTGRDSSVTTFRSRTYGYSIDHPAGWSAIPATDQLEPGQPPLTGPPITDVIAPRPDRAVSRMDLPALVVGAQAVAGGTSIDDWTATVIDIASNQKQCGAPASSEKLEIGGDHAVLLDYPDCPKGTRLNHLWAAVVHGSRGYHIVFFNALGHETDDRVLLDRMLASVSFG